MVLFNHTYLDFASFIILHCEKHRGLRNNTECCGKGSLIGTKKRKIDYLNLKEKAIIGTILASNLSRSISLICKAF